MMELNENDVFTIIKGKKYLILVRRMYKCNYCSKLFKENGNFRTHTGERPYKCVICEKSFITLGNLKSHEYNHTNIRPLKCPIEGCDKYYTRQCRLDIHLRTHTGNKPFKCPLCERGFNEKGNLRIHIRIHTGEKPFLCNYEGCGKAFKAHSHLKDHKKIHTRAKPYNCNICDKEFARSSTLKIHMHTHTESKPHICQFENCGKKFAEKGNMKTHYKTHLKNNKTCDITCTDQISSPEHSILKGINRSSRDDEMKTDDINIIILKEMERDMDIDNETKSEAEILDVKIEIQNNQVENILLGRKVYKKTNFSRKFSEIIEVEDKECKEDSIKLVKALAGKIESEQKMNKASDNCVVIESPGTKSTKNYATSNEVSPGSVIHGNKLTIGDVSRMNLNMPMSNFNNNNSTNNTSNFSNISNISNISKFSNILQSNNGEKNINNIKIPTPRNSSMTPTTHLRDQLNRLNDHGKPTISTEEAKIIYNKIVESMNNIKNTSKYQAYESMIKRLYQIIEEKSHIQIMNLQNILSAHEKIIESRCVTPKNMEMPKPKNTITFTSLSQNVTLNNMNPLSMNPAQNLNITANQSLNLTNLSSLGLNSINSTMIEGVSPTHRSIINNVEYISNINNVSNISSISNIQHIRTDPSPMNNGFNVNYNGSYLYNNYGNMNIGSPFNHPYSPMSNRSMTTINPMNISPPRRQLTNPSFTEIVKNLSYKSQFQ